MPDCMMPFPEDWHDFLKDYSFDDSQEVYTNGSRLIPVFRVEQLIKHLLKSQEPRVMTVEEVVGCVILKRNITLWFEFRNEIKAMNAKDIVYNDFLSDEDFQTLADPNLEWVDGGKRDGVIIAEYNDTFRCWTSRPTDGQRKAVKWE